MCVCCVSVSQLSHISHISHIFQFFSLFCTRKLFTSTITPKRTHNFYFVSQFNLFSIAKWKLEKRCEIARYFSYSLHGPHLCHVIQKYISFWLAFFHFHFKLSCSYMRSGWIGLWLFSLSLCAAHLHHHKNQASLQEATRNKNYQVTIRFKYRERKVAEKGVRNWWAKKSKTTANENNKKNIQATEQREKNEARK